MPLAGRTSDCQVADGVVPPVLDLAGAAADAAADAVPVAVLVLAGVAEVPALAAPALSAALPATSAEPAESVGETGGALVPAPPRKSVAYHPVPFN